MTALEFTSDLLLKNEESLKPPTCCKLMYDGKLKVFFIGGPNYGSEFLVQENEKVVYALHNNITVKVVKNNMIKEIFLKQGDIFVIFEKTEHRIDCPAESIGCIIEKERKPDQLDGIRFFKDGSVEVLWEYWYKTNYKNTEILSYVNEFKNRKDFKNLGNSPYQVNRLTTFDDPINLKKFIDDHKDKIMQQPYKLFRYQNFKSVLKIYGTGLHSIKSSTDEDIIFIPHCGKVMYYCEKTGDNQNFKEFEIIHLQQNTIFKFEILDDGACLSIQLKE